jgi:hypothetical protein
VEDGPGNNGKGHAYAYGHDKQNDCVVTTTSMPAAPGKKK